MAYVWMKCVNKNDEASALLKSGIEANPSRCVFLRIVLFCNLLLDDVNFSFVLNFAYAEVLETNKNYPEVHAAFERFLAILSKDLEQLESRVLSPNSSQNSQNSNGSISNSQQNQTITSDLTLATQPGLQSNHSSFVTQVFEEKPPKSKELANRRTEYGIAWIVYMRFARRAEGQKSARAVFAKARRDRWTPWEVYEAAGKHPQCQKDTVLKLKSVFVCSVDGIPL